MADEDFEGFAGPAADLAAIRDLNDRYCDAVNRRDPHAWGDCWAEDASWSLMGMEVEGRAAIVALWEGAMAGLSFVAFFAQQGAIHVSGDTAQGRMWTNEYLEPLDGEPRRPVGRYDDHYVRTAGGWRYQRRMFTLRRG